MSTAIHQRIPMFLGFILVIHGFIFLSAVMSGNYGSADARPRRFMAPSTSAISRGSSLYMCLFCSRNTDLCDPYYACYPSHHSADSFSAMSSF